MTTLSRRDHKFIREFHAFAATQTGPYQSYRTDTCALAQFMKHKYGKRALFLPYPEIPEQSNSNATRG